MRETGLSPGLGFRPQGLGPENEGGDREADTQDDEERGAPVGGAPQIVPRCDVALWRFLGLSMAGWNVLISLKLAVLSVLAATGFGGRK